MWSEAGGVAHQRSLRAGSADVQTIELKLMWPLPLSVVAVSAEGSNQHRHLSGGQSCRLRPTCSVFSTMDSSTSNQTERGPNFRWAQSAWLPAPSAGDFVLPEPQRGPWSQMLQDWTIQSHPKTWRT